MNADPVTCPNCGYGFEGLRKSTRMFDCPSCGTTLFREADALAPIGAHGEMHETPMLIGIGDTVLVGPNKFDVLGHLRFDYGRGTWDEFWCENRSGRGAWISVDEGDVVLQEPMPEGAVRRGLQGQLRLGAGIRIDDEVYEITELDSAACIAFRGQLPERVTLGETHSFVNATGPEGALISGEFWDEGEAWFAGEWLDPFELRVERLHG
jgi:hypothetical protein